MSIASIKKELITRLPIEKDIIEKANYVENNSIPTVSTDGKDIFYNSDYVQKISEELQMQ